MKSANVRIDYCEEVQGAVNPGSIQEAIRKVWWRSPAPTVTEIPSGPVDAAKMWDDACSNTILKFSEFEMGFVQNFLRDRIQPILDSAYQRGRDDKIQELLTPPTQEQLDKINEDEDKIRLADTGMPLLARSLPTNAKSSLEIKLPSPDVLAEVAGLKPDGKKEDGNANP